MFLNKIRNIFVSRTQNLFAQQMLRVWANGETFVSATMCPQQCVLVCQYLKGPVNLYLQGGRILGWDPWIIRMTEGGISHN